MGSGKERYIKRDSRGKGGITGYTQMNLCTRVIRYQNSASDQQYYVTMPPVKISDCGATMWSGAPSTAQTGKQRSPQKLEKG